MSVALLIVLAAPLPAGAELKPLSRPLSRLMLTNLQATNSIGEALATEDYAGIESAAHDLETTAREMQTWDTDKLGFTPTNRAQFNSYLKSQQEISGKLVSAARRKDDSAIVAGLDEVLGNSCLNCHRDFRDRQGILKTSTIFMTSFVSTWKEINRGLLLNDFTAVARGARTLETAGQVMSWDPVLQAAFHLSTEEERNKFRARLGMMIGAAGRVEDAAMRGESAAVRKALAEMWLTGCLSCHRESR